jgi:hypothetical protein
MKKALFMLRTHKRGSVVTSNGKPVYFTNKVDAKAARDLLRDEGQPDVVVSYGPDHHLFRGN